MGRLRRKKTAKLDEREIVGLKYFKAIRSLLARLHRHRDHPNRELHADEYIALLLLYFFNPVLTSLRTIQLASDLRKVKRKLGVRRASLGSLSEAAHVFDAEVLGEIFRELATRVQADDAPARPQGLPSDLVAIAADGSLLRALPQMVWALWRDPEHHALKLHLQFDLGRGIPTEATLTHANAAETTVLRAALASGRLYVVDRGYRSVVLLREILQIGSSFILRLPTRMVCRPIEPCAVSDEARAAGVEADQIVAVGAPNSRERLDRPLRRVRLRVPHRNGGEQGIEVLTDRLDIPAETIAQLYRYRWHVELFFRWFKCTLGCTHLLSHSANGVALQVYAALIATLLIVLWTGHKPTKYTLTMLALYFQGLAELDEVEAHIARLPAAKV